jgi:hypothetical protein
MLDLLPAQLRHLVLALLPVLAGWAAADGIPWLRDRFPAAALLWTALQTLILYFTPVTKQYGVGRVTKA